MRFSQKALDARPWLWKFDARRKRGCYFNGHRWKNTRWSTRNESYHVACCRRCLLTRVWCARVDLTGRVAKVYKEYVKPDELRAALPDTFEIIKKMVERKRKGKGVLRNQTGSAANSPPSDSKEPKNGQN